MSKDKVLGEKPESKIEFYFLRISAERFSADLGNFEKEIYNFSDAQLYNIVSHCDYIRDNAAKVKKELERRLEKISAHQN